VQWLKAASRFFSFFFFVLFFLFFSSLKKTNRCLSCLRSKAKKSGSRTESECDISFCGFGSFQSAIRLFLWHFTGNIAFICVWMMFISFSGFPAPPEKYTDQTNYLPIQSTNQQTYRPPPAQWPHGYQTCITTWKKWHSGFEPLPVIIYILIEPTLIFRYFVYSLLIFLWPVLLIFFINDYIWAAKFPSN